MTKWDDIFEPVAKTAPTFTPRPQQAQFGQAVIDAIHNEVALVAECPTGTGKSIAYLIPLINAVLHGKEVKKLVRGAVSTETLALQDQISLKDLPFLQSVFPGFTFRVLKGRSNYVCLDQADYSSRGNKKMLPLFQALSMHRSRLGDGEKKDAERILERDLDAYEWSFLSGSSQFCAENKCTKHDSCFSTRARDLALKADIVVINHALLQTDVDMKKGSDIFGGASLLGPLDFLVVDEAHTLEQCLVDGWTETVSEWELAELHGSISKAMDKSRRVMTLDPMFAYSTENALEKIETSLDAIKKYYHVLHENEEWRRVSTALSEKNVFGSQTQGFLHLMEEYEVETPKRLTETIATLERVEKHLGHTYTEMEDQGVTGRRDIGKGISATRQLKKFCELVKESLATKDGIVMRFGVPTGVIVDGYEKRDGTHGIRVRTVPLDISSKAKQIWEDTTPILVSATLSDLTDGSFKYLTTSLGFPEHTNLKTGTPFDYGVQQMTYITRADRPVVDVPGAQYSFEEMVDLLNAAEGRSLVLFTARGELDDCAGRLLQLVAAGMFTHPVYVQSVDSNKQRLVDQFKQERNSVLLATKSFFTGVDFPGDTCSQVIICKFPLPRFDVICKMQMNWWRKRGYPKWYEREALTVFQQAAGRLIRTGTDRGVVSVLDQRVVNPGERVCETARIGVAALGSGVTRSIEDVRAFIR